MAHSVTGNLVRPPIREEPSTSAAFWRLLPRRGPPFRVHTIAMHDRSEHEPLYRVREDSAGHGAERSLHGDPIVEDLKLSSRHVPTRSLGDSVMSTNGTKRY